MVNNVRSAKERIKHFFTKTSKALCMGLLFVVIAMSLVACGTTNTPPSPQTPPSIPSAPSTPQTPSTPSTPQTPPTTDSTTQLSIVTNIQTDSPTKTITFGVVQNATNYTVIVKDSGGHEVFNGSTATGSIKIDSSLTVGSYTINIVATNAGNESFTDSATATGTFAVTKATAPTVTFANNAFTVTGQGEIVTTFNNTEVTLTNNTYALSEGQSGTLKAYTKGDNGFVLNSDSASAQGNYVIQTTQLNAVSNIQTNSPEKTISFGTVDNATSYNVSVTNSNGQQVFAGTTQTNSIKVNADLGVGTYNISVVATTSDVHFTPSAPATGSFAVTQVATPTVTFEDNTFTVTGNGSYYATFAGQHVELVDGTFTLTTPGQTGTFTVRAIGDNGFVLDSELASVQGTYVSQQTQATYADAISALTTPLQTHIQSLYTRGTISNTQIKNIGMKDGVATIYCQYDLGVTTYGAAFTVSGLESATSLQQIVENANNYTFARQGNSSQMQSEQDAKDIVVKTSSRGLVSELSGVQEADIAWATATIFTGKGTNVTVVLNDGTMVEYRLAVDGATNNGSAKEDFLAGKASSIISSSESIFTDLETHINNLQQTQGHSM